MRAKQVIFGIAAGGEGRGSAHTSSCSRGSSSAANASEEVVTAIATISNRNSLMPCVRLVCPVEVFAAFMPKR
jgi:hypothetical protein